MSTDDPTRRPDAGAHIQWHGGQVSPADRAQLLGHKGATLWFTGLSGSGKSTVAVALERRLVQSGVLAYRLDGDNLRHGLNYGLGFDQSDRAENVRRAGEAAKLIADTGAICLACLISPGREMRDAVRAIHKDHNPSPLAFAEVFVDTPLEECERRDPKGLYRKARAGEIANFTGIDSPYEPPSQPEIHLETSTSELEASVNTCLQWLRSRDLIRTPENGS